MRTPPRSVVTVSLAVAATLPGDALLYAVLPVVWADLGLELWMVGVLLAANRMVRLATNPLAGVVASRIGIHRPFTAAVFATTAVTAAYAAAPSFVAWVALRLVWGALWSFLRLGGFLAALGAGAMGRGYALGFYNGVANLGTLTGMATGGLLVDTIGLDATLLVFAALALPAGLAMLREGPNADDRPAPEPGDETATATPALERWGVYGGAILTGMVGSPLVLATLGLLLVERHGESIPVFGLVVGAATLNGAFLGLRFSIQPVWAPLAGHLSDRFGRLRFATLMGLVTIAGMWALSFPGGLGWTFAGAAVAFIGGPALRVSSDALAGDAAPPEARARFLGWYSNATDLGSALGPLLAYPLIEAFGVTTVYRLGAATLFVGGGAVLLTLRHARARPS
jgi:MFS family permease